ncbi:hypothetical protein [Salipiger sp. PrR002]|uniref:hypothetical protein n=1 Tax=Salipiger sp. PrR002 TaxID=2706489 RepID=UPI0013BCB7CC|nr:hypothetical protein [Salipiger sp. PrR002]NDW00233.1 hypothetical protein [Salipiger sp. PrR002]NDW58629.1 hypothetical protein [Salipiger sp. PrR004]
MRGDLAVILEDAPTAVRRAMIDDATNLAPGAAYVMGRFWTAVRAGNGNLSMPPAEAYRAAAASESTFRCLMRALAAYAPHVSTALARVISDEWYALRPKPAPRDAQPVRQPVGASWPVSWQGMKPGLDVARIKASTRKRYFASIDRCAAVVAEGLAPEALGFVAACELSEAFLSHPDENRRVKPVTAGNYIEGLIALGAAGGVAEDGLTAMRVILSDLRDQASLAEKNKQERLSDLMERGGYVHVADRIAVLRLRAEGLPAHSAARRRCMQQAVVCALILNKPPRKGDLVSWRFGQQIIRDIDGTWHAEWEQEKTGCTTEAGTIWPEICDILDEWILDGRPDRLVHIRYQELVGSNWLTLGEKQPYRNLPTELTDATVGVPSHDLRTLAADYLRRHDPSRAADIICTHLGHGTREAGEAYRGECDGAAAQALWREARTVVAARVAKSTGNSRTRPRKSIAVASGG